MNYYKRHIGDYLRDAGHLTLLEHGVYTRLLDVYYTREGAIPSEQAARLVGARTREERDAVDRVLAEFFESADGAWTQRRCEREIEAATTKAERNREIGKRGGRPKKAETQTVKPTDTETEPRNNPDGFQEKPKQNPSQTPDTRLHKPEKEEQRESRARSARSRAPSKTPLPDGFVVSARVEAWAQERGFTRLSEHYESFVSKARAKGYVYADWDEAFMNAIRDDWAGLQSTSTRNRRESVSDFNRRSTEEALAMLGNDARTIDA